jgi:hypothetical protein
LQASLHLPNINLMVLQASVVEEMCAFSALDNVRDITCVSLLALGIQVRGDFFSLQTLAVIQLEEIFSTRASICSLVERR